MTDAEPAELTLQQDANAAVLVALHIAPNSWRTRYVGWMINELIDGWRVFGVLTDIPVTKTRVLDLLVTDDALTGPDAERLDIALTIGARIANHHMETNFAGSGSARKTYAEWLTKTVAHVALQRGIFFMTPEQVDAAARELGPTSRWR